MEKVKVGIVGISNHGVTIRNAARSCKNIEIVSCYDINKDELDSFASSIKCKSAKDYDEIVTDPSIDAIILVTPNHQHLEQGLKAVRNNKHIFVEKPITNTVRESVELVKEAKKLKRILQVGHNMRKRIHYRETKKILDNGQIGDIVAFYAQFSHDGGFNPKTPKWKIDKSTCPLLPMMQLGIHFIDTIHYLLSDVKKVSCFGGNFAMGKGIIDTSLANLILENGVMGNLQSHYVIPSIFEFKIFGTKGIVTCTDHKFRLESIECGQKKIEEKAIDENKYNSFEFEMQEFADSVISNKQPEVDGLAGIKSLSVIEAMNVSLKENRIVDIREVFTENMLS